MDNPWRELRWLIALEASVCLSLPCWDLTAPWAEPATYPLRFAGVVILSATAALLLFHIGPALLAEKVGAPSPRLVPLLLIWLGAGYVERILAGLASVFNYTRPSTQTAVWDFWSIGSILLFAAVLAVAATSESRRKMMTPVPLLLGVGILIWALSSNWRGLWAHNPHFSQEGPVQFDWILGKGMLLAAAPVVVIAWKMGRFSTRHRQIWWSGLVGLWLPLVVSVTIASLADQAGATLYFRPSLPRGLQWALLGPQGQSLSNALPFAVWTLLSPALVSVISLKELLLPWTGWKRLCFVLVGVVLLNCVAKLWVSEGLFSEFEGPAYMLWAWSVVLAGGITLSITPLVRRSP